MSSINISVIMGSKSDFTTMKHCVDVIDKFNIPYEKLVISAHRTPDKMFEFAKSAKSRGIKVIIAAAGGAAHLPGMVASLTTLPVIGVPIASTGLLGLDSLLSIVQMPFGIPVCTMSIGESGAKNAALAAIAILSLQNPPLAKKLEEWRARRTQEVLDSEL